MKKIAVIGCCGAGKSSLSLKLAKILSVPVYHLDRIYWKSGWLPTKHDEFLKAQEDIFVKDNWIIDGNYGSTMEARLKEANLIIFLDLPTTVCLWGILQRYLKYRKTSRPDMTEGNNERLTLEFLWYVCSYRIKRRPMVLKRLDSLKGKEIVILASRKEIEDYLKDTANKHMHSNL